MEVIWEALENKSQYKKEILGTPTSLGIMSLLGVHLFLIYLKYAY